MSVFTQANLPDNVKESLCRELLAEFGATNITSNNRGELHHCCVMPWHDERHPSASLNYLKLTYNCFSCSSSGGLLWLIATCRNIPSGAAREWVDNQTGLGDESDLGSLLDLIEAIYRPSVRDSVPIPQMSTRVLDPWLVVHPYLTEIRGVPLKNILQLKVGYSANYQVSETQTGERIIIPHFWKGKLVGWQSRRIWDDGTPKYLSTGDFPRDRTIYNYDPDREFVVVVESPSSVLRHVHHQPMEGTFGSEVTDKQVRLLAHHRRVVLFPDPDPAGWRSVLGHTVKQKGSKPIKVPGIIERLEPYTDVWVVDNPYAADAGDMDDSTVDKLVENAVPACVWHRPEQLLEWEVK